MDAAAGANRDTSPSKKKVRLSQKSGKSGDHKLESGSDHDDSSGSSDDSADDSDGPASEFVEEDPNILKGISASNILHGECGWRFKSVSEYSVTKWVSRCRSFLILLPGKRRRKPSVYAMMNEPKGSPRARKQDASSEEEEEADL